MKGNQVGFVLLLLFSISVHLLLGEQFYIVTSASPCPTREQGEPCLTLEQYTANCPSWSANVTLYTAKSELLF